MWYNLIMKEKEIIDLYVINKKTLRDIAGIFNTNHHKIKRILIKNNIKLSNNNRIRKPFTDEHKKRIGLASKGRVGSWLGKKATKDMLYKNMKAHLKYDVSLEWLSQFNDIEKLKYLNRSISHKRDCEGFTTKTYKQFIEKFYYDEKFNSLFDKWIESGDKWIKPSLDHIKAKSQNGSLLVGNLQFISWLENRAKIDIEQEEWNKMKERIYDYF